MVCIFCSFSAISWKEAQRFCTRYNKKLFKYTNYKSLMKLYLKVKDHINITGWHGLGDIVFVGAKVDEKVCMVSMNPLLIIPSWLSWEGDRKMNHSQHVGHHVSQLAGSAGWVSRLGQLAGSAGWVSLLGQ